MEELRNAIMLAVCGDDAVLAVSPDYHIDGDALAAQYLRLGLIAKVRAVPFHSLCFLGSQAWPTENGWTMAPILGRALPRLGWSLIHQPKPAVWFAQVCEGATHSFSPVPYIRDAINHIRTTAGHLNCERRDDHPGKFLHKEHTCAAAYRLFHLRYPDVDGPHLIREMTCPGLPCILNGPNIRRLVDRDGFGAQPCATIMTKTPITVVAGNFCVGGEALPTGETGELGAIPGKFAVGAKRTDEAGAPGDHLSTAETLDTQNVSQGTDQATGARPVVFATAKRLQKSKPTQSMPDHSSKPSRKRAVNKQRRTYEGWKPPRSKNPAPALLPKAQSGSVPIAELQRVRSDITRHLTKNSPGGGASTMIAKMFALPSLTPPPRIAIDCQTQATTTSALRYVFDLDVTSTAATTGNDICVPGSGFLVLSRSPFHCLAYTKYINTPKQLTSYMPNPIGIVGFSSYQTIVSNGGNARVYPINIEYQTGQVGCGAQSDVLYTWADHGRRWVWMDKGDSITFSTALGPTPAANDCMCVYGWDMSAPLEMGNVLFSIGAFSPGNPGWYSFDANISAAGTYKIALTQNKPTGMLTIWESLPALSSQASSIARVRILGASLMLSNRASALNSAGTVGGFTVPGGEDLLSYLTLYCDPITNLSTLPSGAEFPLSKGCHAIHKPDGLDCLKFHAAFNQTGGVYDGSTVMRPSPEGGYVVIGYRGPATGTNMYGGNSFLISAFFGVETTPLTQWGNSLPPTVSGSQLEAALMILAHVPTFHENPVHIAAILGALRAAGAFALRWAPSIMAALETGVRSVSVVKGMYNDNLTSYDSAFATPKPKREGGLSMYLRAHPQTGRRGRARG